MLRKLTDLRGYAIQATDDFIGTVSDFYFDDEDWGVRYLVVDTGKWLSGRKVLISPLAIGPPDSMTRVLPVSLTKAQVEGSPDIDTRKPVSRQHEAEYFRYYGYPYYWGGAGLWGMGGYPGSLTTQDRIKEDLKAHATHATPAADDCHLRSSNAVIGYQIKATDGDIGHLEDLLVDDYTWAIRYLIVGTSNWWGGQHVLVAAAWIKDVSWPEATVSVELTRQSVKDAPPYNSSVEVDRPREQDLYEHYGRPAYWTVETLQRRPETTAHHAVPEARTRRRS